MKTKCKALLLLLSSVLLVAATGFGTLAYLTDTEAVTNTFTVGKVILGDENLEKGLDEALVNEYGTPIDNNTDKNEVALAYAPRVQTNDYKLIPGYIYTKDPTVHVKNDSEDSYIFVKIANGIADIEADTESTEGGYKNIADQVLANNWQKLSDSQGNYITNVYWKKWEKSADTPGTTDLLVFSQFKIDGEKTVNVAAGEDVPEGKFNIAEYANDTIVVTAYAIQADGFETASQAWIAGKFE